MRLYPLFVFLVFCACNQSPRSSFPHIHLNIAIDSIPVEDKKGCSIQFQEEETDIQMSVGIEYRGSASRKFPKRSYSIHLRNKGKKIRSWNGLTLQGNWVLYGPYADRTCIRNALAQALFQKMGHYSPKSLFTELTIDTAYMGLYEWREKIDLSAGRVPQATHILKIDKPTAKIRPQWPSILNPLVFIRFHDSLPGHSINAAFLAVERFEQSLLKKTNEWEQLVDKRSFIDYFLFSEWANSPDAYRSSCYFQVLSDGKLRMGPLWDFDLAFGNSILFQAQGWGKWRFRINDADSLKNLAAPSWWTLMFDQTDFKRELRVRWRELRGELFTDSALSKQVDELVAGIRPVALKNQDKWKVMERKIQWTLPPEKSYDEEVNRLKRWMFQRAAWMDGGLK
ncbi:MAG: hypothetical protein FJX92_01475 [Bacteroidetes bacterium]|nr:hypothetical protein [Bacteroidota bacterium]